MPDRTALRLLLAVALALLLGSTQARAQAGALGRIAGGVDDAVRAGARVEGRALGATDEVVRGLGTAERKAIEEAERDFMLASPVATMTRDLDLLAQAAKALRLDAKVARTAAPFPDLPNLRIKLAASTVFDEVIARMARVRLKPMLEQRLDPEQLKVVPLALADDAAVSAREASRTVALVGRSRVDEVGPLALLERWAGVSRDEMIGILRPYRGKTVILIGHLPDQSKKFFVFGRGGEKVGIDIERLSDAAAEAGVNLIPLGCNSGTVARIGLAGNVNSRLLARRIRDALEREPRTMGQFLSHLAGPEMEMLVDALNVRFFSDGFSLLNRRFGVEVARLLIRTVPKLRKMRSEVAFDSCFPKATPAAFQACAIALAGEEARRTAAERERVARANRARDLALMPGRLAEANRALETARRDWLRFTLFYCIAIVPLWLYFYHVMVGVAMAEADGRPLRQGFTREYVRASLASPPFLLADFAQQWRFLLTLLGSVVFVAVPFFVSGRGQWGAVYAGAGIGLSISFVLSSIKQRSVAMLLAIPAIGLAAVLAGYYAIQGRTVSEKQAQIDSLARERADLLSDSPHAEWRRVWDWELQDDPFGAL